MQSIKSHDYFKIYQNQLNQKSSNEQYYSKIPFNTKILVFFAFVLIFRITILVRKRPVEDFAVIDDFAMIEIVAVGLTILFLFFSSNLKEVVNYLSKSSAKVLLIYCIVSIVSSLWSPIAGYTFFRAVQVASQLLVVFVVLYEFKSFSSAEQFVLRAGSLLMVINLLGQFKLVKYDFSFAGLHSNTYSNSAAMIFCYCFHEYFESSGKDRKRFRNYGLFNLLGIVIGTSATSNIATLISIFFARFIFYKKISIGMLSLTMLVIIITVLFSQNILNREVSDIILAGKDPHSVRTMSGRMHIWTTYIEVAKERLILGHGFAITTRIGALRVNTAHNVSLAIALDLGIAGLFLFLWGGLRLVRESIQPGPQPMRGRLGALSVFIAAFIACQSTPFIATHWHAPNAVFALFLALHTLYLRSPALAASSSSTPIGLRRERFVRDVWSRRFRKPLSSQKKLHDSSLIR